MASKLNKSPAEFCGCNNCIDLKCIFKNVTGLQSFIQQFQFAFSKNLPPNINKEMKAFLNSNWNWDRDLTHCKGKAKTGKNDGYSNQRLNGTCPKCKADDGDDCTITPKMADKCASALLELEDESTENVELGSKKTTWSRCTVCELSFKTLEHLKRHMESHEVTHECSECQTGFYSLEEASKHVCQLINSDLQDCEEVGPSVPNPVASANTKRRKVEEIVMHHKDENNGTKSHLLRCKHCDTYFIDRGELEEHEKSSHHTVSLTGSKGVNGCPSDDSYCCGLCGKTSKTFSAFSNHIRSQHKKLNNTCEVCGKVCSSFFLLVYHMACQHQRACPPVKTAYKCSVCGKTFSSLNNVKIHFKTHSGKNTYSNANENGGQGFQTTSLLN